MSGYVILLGSILLESFGSTMMKMSKGYTVVLPTIGVVLGYGTSFYLLSIAVKQVPLSVAYATWAGLGTILAATVGRFVFKEPIRKRSLAGIGLVVSGVVLLNLSGVGH